MKILALGDLHGKFPDKLKKKLNDVDLILLTGDLGSANLMRKRTFENIERKRQGLQEVKYSPAQKKKHLWKLIIPV